MVGKGSFPFHLIFILGIQTRMDSTMWRTIHLNWYIKHSRKLAFKLATLCIIGHDMLLTFGGHLSRNGGLRFLKINEYFIYK